MAAITWELDLTGFRFPAELPRKRANFRFVVDLRYVTKRGDHTTEHAVLPGLDRWWECDPERSDRQEYARGEVEGDRVLLDMSAVDDWDRLILLVRGDAIHSIQFKVFDVNRPGTLDRIRKGLGDVVGSLLGRARSGLPDVAGVFSDSLGSAATDLESALITRLAGADRLLFRGSARLPEPGDYVIEGRGEDGAYRIDFALKTV
ncbi:MAG: hypothetical protein M8857_11720 [marine benthic group bacterium]|nr:hypothetical protein [Gemmatimonadota bacterium]MCL7968167.1 hypothetical protein [Gemmatimonadota bacterium]